MVLIEQKLNNLDFGFLGKARGSLLGFLPGIGPAIAGLRDLAGGHADAGKAAGEHAKGTDIVLTQQKPLTQVLQEQMAALQGLSAAKRADLDAGLKLGMSAEDLFKKTGVAVQVIEEPTEIV